MLTGRGCAARRRNAMMAKLGAALLAAGSLFAGGAEVRPDWKAPLERAGIRFISAVELPEDKPLRFVDVRRSKRLLHPERLPADRGRLLVFYCGGPN